MSCEGTIKIFSQEKLAEVLEVIVECNFERVGTKGENKKMAGHYVLHGYKPFPCVDVYNSGVITFANGAREELLPAIQEVVPGVRFTSARGT